jgi:hypothetical protein
MRGKKRQNNQHFCGHLKNIFCLLLAALLLGGCASPFASEKNTASSEAPSDSGGQSAKDSEENSDEPSGSSQQTKEQSSEDSGSDQQSSEDSSEEDFNFNQTLTLKVPEPAAGENPRILFVGNSHTYANDLPVIFSEIAAAMGHPADVQEVTEGAYTLTQFADTADEWGSVVNQKLTEEPWDFVILQENTNDAFSSAEETMLPAALALDEKIRAAGGQTGLLMTWTPKDGAGIMGREYVQSILAQNTIAVSERLDSLLIPGGMGFMRCLEQYPQIELWNEDGMHPSLEGSYLAGCIAYAVIFRESPAGCSYTAELDGETAAQLQELAAGFLAE